VHLGFDVMKTLGIWDTTNRDIIGIIAVCRSDLLKRIDRWTQGRKIKLCRGLCAEVIIASEVMLAHGLAQDEIDCWMDAYNRKDFEALKVEYCRKGTAARRGSRCSDVRCRA
jgi:hypothetical protein